MLKNTKINKIMKSGFSLMEMVIVIIIIGILLAGITKMTGATKSAKVTTLNQNITNLATAAMTWGDQYNSGSYENIKIDTMITDGVLGNDWNNGAKKKNPFAGGLKIQAINDNNGFKIIADGIPSDICKKYDSGKFTVSGADKVSCSSKKLEVSYGSDNTANGN